MNELTIDQRVKLEGIARDIRMSGKRAALEIVNIGKSLIEARGILEGGFTKWVEFELNMSPRLAENFMNCAYRFGATPEIIAGVPPTILYSLAAPSTPEKVISIVLDRVANGEKLKVKDVQQIYADNKPPRPGKAHAAVADAAETVKQELIATGGHVSVDGESIEAAITEAAAEAVRPDNELIARKLDLEDGVDPDTKIKGRAIVDFVSRDGRVTIFSQALAEHLERGMRIGYVIWEHKPDPYSRPVNLVAVARGDAEL